MLEGKKIVLGISGSIAAYKSIVLLRLLIKAGADVQCVLTPAAKDFVSPLVLSTLSKHPVVSQLQEGEEWSNHVALGRWADLMILAPASCNTLAKMAHGLCDNVLLAVYLSATCPVLVVPAMDEDMWHHPATRANLQTLASYGNNVMPTQHGELASGLVGMGRMAEPEDILVFATEHFFRQSFLAGKKALVTAGPTHEPIDPVRFIGNRSSGKMGLALAEALYLAGAEVQLVAGPMERNTAFKGIQQHKVNTAAEMFQAVEKLWPHQDLGIFNAAVADFTPATLAAEKIKKSQDHMSISLVPTTDILAACGHAKQAQQFIMGFALETENESANATLKLNNKNADVIVLNALRHEGVGFGADTNRVTLFTKGGESLAWDLMDKQTLAQKLVWWLGEKLKK
ncbi:MAG: bifunctional phosphopantothenoylcysteine decarboxylase/phosphopantothenate--cysteine ligase CoaBC [Sphingobacteriia bacterium]|nr:MAG: bifunctional phosphopantothenoylcysteine decarboxylase/phosphopantothenate--cysteine ligase CoaBC [Sphingobacteriia bacterium]